MKIAYATAYDARSLKGSNEWSGLGYYISQTLNNQGIDMEYLETSARAIYIENYAKVQEPLLQIFSAYTL